jgi:hypothetical protein
VGAGCRPSNGRGVYDVALTLGSARPSDIRGISLRTTSAAPPYSLTTQTEKRRNADLTDYPDKCRIPRNGSRCENADMPAQSSLFEFVLKPPRATRRSGSGPLNQRNPRSLVLELAEACARCCCAWRNHVGVSSRARSGDLLLVFRYEEFLLSTHSFPSFLNS